MQIEVPQIIPVAALVAIVLFIFREVFDFVKSKKNISRELKAAKYLITQEVERNFRSAQRIFQLANYMDDEGLHEHISFSIVKMESGSLGYNGKHKFDESFHCFGSFSEFFLNELNRWLPFIAKNNEKFLNESIEMHACLLELNRFRSMFIDEMSDGNSLQSLSRYVLQYEKEIELVFKKYYKSCTGKTELPKFFK